ncbi:myosin-IIIb-like [Tropilaelaps mercedesae]|uniref:Myosin-IIIb-like n=1 Tax=Tropilaelaps mercedesae TaxID=418985 RepID=A0A1V9XFL1_9ACAR|nr:myosin-IIIb-like [Tropilaelaps mercedesae]
MHPCRTEDLRRAVAKKATPCTGQCSNANNCNNKHCSSAKAPVPPVVPPVLSPLGADNIPRKGNAASPSLPVMPARVAKGAAPASPAVPSTATAAPTFGQSPPGSNSTTAELGRPNSSGSSSGGRPSILEIESWWEKRSQRSTPSPGSTEPNSLDPADDPLQGPFHFKKILKSHTHSHASSSSSSPSPPGHSHNGQLLSRQISRAGDGDVNRAGVFDFRKVLRRTAIAPTETLRRCKGLLPPNENDDSKIISFLQIE